METMESTRSRLLVDVGQTGSRVQDSRGKRHVFDTGFTPGTPLEDVVRKAISAIEQPHADTVVLSLTGLRGMVPALEPFASICVELTGCSSVGMCDDGLAWSVGSLRGGDGVALAVGGGVVAVARRGNRFVHLDGNGSDFGDSGGAFWIGRKALRASIRALEGSGPNTTLADHFVDWFGPHDDFVRGCVTREEIHRAALDFAPRVLEAGSAEDTVAAEILRQGAERLGALVSAATVQLGLERGATQVALGGGLMRDEGYRALVVDTIVSEGLDIEVVDPWGDALDGLDLLEREGRTNIMRLMTWWNA